MSDNVGMTFAADSTDSENDAETDTGVDADTGAVSWHSHDEHSDDTAEFWERFYSDTDRIWSGRVNTTLADAVVDLAPGLSLDLGCGEGGDVIWLAGRGWRATGIDLSSTAVRRGREAADAQGIPSERVRFLAGDLAEWAADPEAFDGSPVPFDLITASFLQSPVHLAREDVLRAALGRLAPGGLLVTVSHAAPPPWANAGAHEHGPREFHTPDGELIALGLSGQVQSHASSFEVRAAEIRTREATGPDGERAVLDDCLVVVRRVS